MLTERRDWFGSTIGLGGWRKLGGAPTELKNASKSDLGAWGAWVPHFSRSLREVGPLTYSSRQAQARAHVHPLTGVEIGGALGEGRRVSAQIPTARKQREKWGTRPQIPTSRKQREKWGTRRFI